MNKYTEQYLALKAEADEAYESGDFSDFVDKEMVCADFAHLYEEHIEWDII